MNLAELPDQLSLNLKKTQASFIYFIGVARDAYEKKYLIMNCIVLLCVSIICSPFLIVLLTHCLCMLFRGGHAGALYRV